MTTFWHTLPDMLQHIILRQGIGSLPVYNLYVGFLCRMDVELVEHHHLLVLQVVERPFLRLAVGRDVCRERRVAGLGKLYPHLAHGLAEGFIERPSRVGGELRVVEHDGKLYGMSAFHDRIGRLGREVVGETFAAALGLLFRNPDDGCNEPAPPFQVVIS